MLDKLRRNDRPERPGNPEPRRGDAPQKQRAGSVQRLSRITSIAVAIAIAALGFGAYMVMSSTARLQSINGETTTVVVAQSEIPRGDEVASGDVALRELPKNAVPATALTDVSAAVGQHAQSQIESGSVLTAGDVTGDAASTAAGRIEEGQVAISITVNQQTGVAGLVHQGDKVSVLNVIEGQGEASARVVAQHARVIALDEKTDTYDSGYTALTLVVSPADAQAIAAALGNGKVSVVLESAAAQD